MSNKCGQKILKTRSDGTTFWVRCKKRVGHWGGHKA